MILQPLCWVPYSTFFLPCSSWTCEVNPLGPTTSCSTASVRLCRIVWISSRLWFCGTRCSQQFILVLLIYCCEDRATLVPIHIGNLSEAVEQASRSWAKTLAIGGRAAPGWGRLAPPGGLYRSRCFGCLLGLSWTLCYHPSVADKFHGLLALKSIFQFVLK